MPVRIRGAVAQLGERGLCKPEVVGSNPISSTKYGDGWSSERPDELRFSSSCVPLESLAPARPERANKNTPREWPRLEQVGWPIGLAVGH